jgi:putative addiction module killer protein
MIEIRQSAAFMDWFARLRDERAKSRIIGRLDRVALGHLGDAKSVGGGVHELRIDYGPGYRLYFAWRGKTVVLLLCGGDKSTQASDIKQAIAMAKEI